MHLYDLKIKSALIFCMAIQSSLKITYNFNITHMCVTLTVTVVISCSIRSQAPNYTPDNTLEHPFRGFVQFSHHYNKPKMDYTSIISLLYYCSTVFKKCVLSGGRSVLSASWYY